MLSKKRTTQGCEKGFSLIEVMVALVVVAVSLGAVIAAVGGAASNEIIVGEQTFARWVAMNQLAEVRLKRKWPKIGKTNGTESMAGVDWKWEQNVIKTPDDDVRRLEISARKEGAEKKGASANIVGFIVNPGI
jgi:general secretion pathway protein I